ncbi:MAG: hypothetical protein ACYC6M_09120 [Terriglobales bacterium]
MRQVMVELEESDYALLRAVAEAAGVPRVQIVRWALRYYGLSGPWCDRNVDRAEIVGGDSLDCGPGLRRLV